VSVVDPPVRPGLRVPPFLGVAAYPTAEKAAGEIAAANPRADACVMNSRRVIPPEERKLPQAFST
jgi:hypothetical protein